MKSQGISFLTQGGHPELEYLTVVLKVVWSNPVCASPQLHQGECCLLIKCDWSIYYVSEKSPGGQVVNTPDFRSGGPKFKYS